MLKEQVLPNLCLLPNIIDRNWPRTTNGLLKCSRSGTNGDRRDKTAFRIDSLRLPIIPHRNL